MIYDQEGKETMIHNTFSRGKKLIPCIAAAGMLCLQVLVLPAAAEPEDQRFSAFSEDQKWNIEVAADYDYSSASCQSSELGYCFVNLSLNSNRVIDGSPATGYPKSLQISFQKLRNRMMEEITGFLDASELTQLEERPRTDGTVQIAFSLLNRRQDVFLHAREDGVIALFDPEVQEFVYYQADPEEIEEMKETLEQDLSEAQKLLDDYRASQKS